MDATLYRSMKCNRPSAKAIKLYLLSWPGGIDLRHHILLGTIVEAEFSTLCQKLICTMASIFDLRII